MKRRRQLSVESIMVTLLLIILSASVSILIYQGSVTYQKILSEKEAEENARIALSFVNMKIKENDMKGHISIETIENQRVLFIKHHGEEDGLYTYIYSRDGMLWECYTDGDLVHELSEPIVALDDMQFEYSNNRKQIITHLASRSKETLIELTQKVTLRSFGQGVDL